MKKTEQYAINRECLQAMQDANKEINSCWKYSRLRTCTAEVWESEHYYFLKSYNTFVAFIDKRTDTLFDVLRYVYGYTSTSVQHISKFQRDYGFGKWGCKYTKRWYSV